jgi:aldose 1-epimerase
MKVVLSDLGASLVSLSVPDRKGRVEDVTLGFDRLADYLDPENPSMGATIGRAAGRINKGHITLDGKAIQLSDNDHGNHLNGGARGFDRQLWRGKIIPGENAVAFNRLSPEGEEGYPGNLDVEVTYRVSANNSLQIDYRAKSDQDTIVNLTNHAYYNLNGGGTIEGHQLTIPARSYLPQTTASIPTGEIASVAGTPFDFQNGSQLGRQWPDNGTQPAGYNHTLILDKGARFAAKLSSPQSGRWMQIETTEPGLLLYTGNYLPSAPTGRGGYKYPAHAGVCLETLHFPDAPNHPSFPSISLKKGETYQSSTTYTFGAE